MSASQLSVGIEIAAPQTVERNSVDVGGIRLSYLESGIGNPILLLPGWSQTAEQFRFQLSGLAHAGRVISLDMRGHGCSDKPNYGYRIQVLARDLELFLSALGLDNVTLLGHSMGCAVAWCHFDLFGSERIARYIFADQPAILVRNGEMTPQDISDYGSVFTPEAVDAFCGQFRGAGSRAATETFLRGCLRPEVSNDIFSWILRENLKMTRMQAADLLYSSCHQDWRDVFPRIDKPALVIGTEEHGMPVSALRWIAGQIGGAELKIFSPEEKASHFMFIENPDAFNGLVANFLG